MELASPWPRAKRPIIEWYALATAAAWRSPHDVHKSDPTVSVLANRRLVFNILGNKFRLIVKVDYAEQKLFIRFFGTHERYNTITAEEI